MEKIELELNEKLQSIGKSCTITNNSKKIDLNNAYRKSLSLNSNLFLSKEGGGLDSIIYHLVPPQNRSVQERKTVIILKGGPGSTFKGQEMHSLKNFQQLLIDYPGFGYNEFENILLGISDNLFNQKTFSKILEFVIKHEIDLGSITNYVILGHSYASVAATMLTSHLSTLESEKYRPSGAWLSGWSLFLDAKVDSNDLSSEHIKQTASISYQPKFHEGKLCVLPQGDICYDDLIFQKIPTEHQSKIKEGLYQVFEPLESLKDLSEHGIAFFLREALHFSSLKGPENAANFLLNTFRGGVPNYEEMCSFYQNKYKAIPWIKRNLNSASSVAAIYGYACEQDGKGRYCKCFNEKERFSSINFPIENDVPIFVFTSKGDGQTPMAEAKASFEKLRAERKYIGFTCNSGHKFSPILKFKNAEYNQEFILSSIINNPESFHKKISNDSCLD